jgi:hypothetical protein
MLARGVGRWGGEAERWEGSPKTDRRGSKGCKMDRKPKDWRKGWEGQERINDGLGLGSLKTGRRG